MKLIRILTYSGSKEAIERTLRKSAVSENAIRDFGDFSIHCSSAFVKYEDNNEPCDHCYGLRPKSPWLSFCPACGRDLRKQS